MNLNAYPRYLSLLAECATVHLQGQLQTEGSFCLHRLGFPTQEELKEEVVDGWILGFHRRIISDCPSQPFAEKLSGTFTSEFRTV